MEKKTTGTAITKNFAKKMETISPFELKTSSSKWLTRVSRKWPIPC